MKVGIFGDSYADEKIHKLEAKYKSWVEILREKYYPDLTCYGEAGSSLYFSYDKFLDNHTKYDKIIFITTTDGRITIPNYIKFLNHPDTYKMYHINSVETAESHLVKPGIMTPEGILATKAAIEYYKYLHDPIYDSRMRSLMKDSIKNIRSDSIIIDTLPPGLSDISYYEFSPYGDKLSDMWKYHDHRMCHLTKRNNEILAEKMFEWCNGAPVQVNVKDFVIPSREELFQLLVK